MLDWKWGAEKENTSFDNAEVGRATIERATPCQCKRISPPLIRRTYTAAFDAWGQRGGSVGGWGGDLKASFLWREEKGMASGAMAISRRRKFDAKNHSQWMISQAMGLK